MGYKSFIESTTSKDDPRFKDLYLFHGKSAYQAAVEYGYKGTEEEWLASIRELRWGTSLADFEALSDMNKQYGIAYIDTMAGKVYRYDEETKEFIDTEISTYDKEGNPIHTTFLKRSGGIMTGENPILFEKSEDEARLSNHIRFNTGNDRIGADKSGNLGMFASGTHMEFRVNSNSEDYSGTFLTGETFRPRRNNAMTLGMGSYQWTNVFAQGMTGKIGTVDGWGVRSVVDDNDNGYAEIFTKDDGNEVIYARQYKAGAVLNEIQLLDADGDTVLRDLIVKKTTNLAGSLRVVGAALLGSTLGVTGAVTLANTLAVTGATTLKSTLGVTGATTLSDTLSVSKGATFASTIDVTGASTLKSTLAVTGATTLNDTLSVAKAATFASTVDITGATKMTSTLDVTGATTLKSTLAVTGKTTLKDALSGTSASFSNALSALSATLNGDLTIISANTDKWIHFVGTNVGMLDHDWRIGYVGSGTSNENYLQFESSGSAMEWSTALRFGAHTLDAEFGGNVDPLTDNSLTMGNSAKRWANIYAVKFTGALDGNADTATALETGRYINVGTAVTATKQLFDGTGDITIPITAINPAYVSQSASYRMVSDTQIAAWNDKPTQAELSQAIADLVNGSPALLNTLDELAAALGDDPNFATTMATELGKKYDKAGGEISGAVTMKSTLAVTGKTTLTGALAANGGLTATTGSFSSTLSVTGATTLTGKLTANGGLASTTGTFSSTLSVTGKTTLGVLEASGAATLKSTLAVTGATTLTGKLTANGGLASTTGTFSSTLAVTGATTLTGKLTANGGLASTSGTFSTTLEVTGATTLKSTLAVTGATTLTGKLTANGGLASTTGTFSGALTGASLSLSGDLTLNAANEDRFIHFKYTDETASWKIGYLGSGSGEENYFVIQSNGNTTNTTAWTNALRLGLTTRDAQFSGNVYPAANNSKTLGTSSLKWSNVYATTFTGALSGNATTATTAAKLGRNGDTATPMTFNWSGQSGQPSWLWGGNDGSTMYVYNPSNFNVNHAVSSDKLKVQTHMTTTAQLDAFIEASRFKYGTFKLDTDYSADIGPLSFGSNDGMILSIPWTTDAYGFQIAFDDTTDGKIAVRGKSTSWGKWYRLIHSGNYTTYCATAGHTHDTYYHKTGGPISGAVSMASTLAVTGRITANGKISVPNTGCTFVGGMNLDNCAIKITTQNGTSTTYHPMMGGKTNSGHYWNIGSYVDAIGFYGFKSGRTENNYDWAAQWDVATGNFTNTGTITGSKVYNAVWNDYAEWYEREDLKETFEPGDIVTWSEDGVVKTTEAFDPCVVGVYSDTYGHIVGGEWLDDMENNIEKNVPVGLCGRVHVKVVGKANRGDLIVSSDIPGVGMAISPKDAYPGVVVGKVLKKKETEEIEKIKIQIMLQ